MNRLDDTRIQTSVDPAGGQFAAPRRPRRGLLGAVAAGVATLTVGGVMLAGCGGDDRGASGAEVAGTVLGPGRTTGPTGSVLSTSSPADPPVPTNRPTGDSPQAGDRPGGQQGSPDQGGSQNDNGGGNGSTTPAEPPPTVPPTTPSQPGAPQLLASPLSLNYGMSKGSRSVTIKNTGGSTLQWSATPDKAWLTVTPGVGTVEPGTEVQVQVKALPTGNPGQGWGGSILFNSNGGSFAMPVSGIIKPHVTLDPDLVVVLPVKPVIQSVTVPGMVCKNAPIAVAAKVTGQVSSVKLERTAPSSTYDMAYNDATDVATKVFPAPGFNTVVKVTVKATGPGGTVESAAHNVVISPFC